MHREFFFFSDWGKTVSTETRSTEVSFSPSISSTFLKSFVCVCVCRGADEAVEGGPGWAGVASRPNPVWPPCSVDSGPNVPAHVYVAGVFRGLGTPPTLPTTIRHLSAPLPKPLDCSGLHSFLPCLTRSLLLVSVLLFPGCA